VLLFYRGFSVSIVGRSVFFEHVAEEFALFDIGADIDFAHGANVGLEMNWLAATIAPNF
jgi:hypothetical protein